MQLEVEHLTGLAGLKIIRAVIEDEVMRRVGPRHQPDPASSCLRWGQQPGYVVKQLNDYATGTRATGPNGIMQIIAKRLSPDEIKSVASYVEGIR